MTDFELGYVVGLFEGEGFIALNLQKTDTNEHYGINIGFSNNSFETLEKVKSILGCGKIFKRRATGRWQPNGSLIISKQKDALSFLEKVYPYLIIKKEKAELIIEFLKLRISYDVNSKPNFQRGYTPYEKTFYNRYRSLKSFIPNTKRNRLKNALSI